MCKLLGKISEAHYKISSQSTRTLLQGKNNLQKSCWPKLILKLNLYSHSSVCKTLDCYEGTSNWAVATLERKSLEVTCSDKEKMQLTILLSPEAMIILISTKNHWPKGLLPQGTRMNAARQLGKGYLKCCSPTWWVACIKCWIWKDVQQTWKVQENSVAVKAGFH